MENIDLISSVSPTAALQLPKDLALKQTYGLVFKEILDSLVTQDSELDDAFKADDDRENSYGASPDLSAYTGQFVDSFLTSAQGQQILGQIYNTADINSIEGTSKE